jgi:formamidopyrimidine-DNA glycosylase
MPELPEIIILAGQMKRELAGKTIRAMKVLQRLIEYAVILSVLVDIYK